MLGADRQRVEREGARMLNVKHEKSGQIRSRERQDDKRGISE